MNIKHIRDIKLTKKQIDIAILIFLGIAILAVSLILALPGSRVYGNASADEKQRNTFDAAMFFTDRLRHCESFSDVRTASVGGEIPALVITSEDGTPAAGDEGNADGTDEKADGTNAKAGGSDSKDAGETETWYFVFDGHLRSSAITPGDNVSPESGDIIMAMESADFRTLKNGLLEISFTTEDGISSAVNISLADEGGGSDG